MTEAAMGDDVEDGARDAARAGIGDTLRGLVIGGVLFGGVAAVQAMRAGVSLVTVVQPILVFALIGLTVGGLAGPLIGRAVRRRRERS